jgi:hypothetical protein
MRAMSAFAAMSEKQHRSGFEYAMLWLTNFAVITISTAIIFVSTTMFWPYTVFSHMDMRIVNEVHVGGEFIIEMDYCKVSTITPHRVTVALQDSITILLYSRMHPLQPGCHVTRVSDMLPAKVPAGVYVAETVAEYQPWPWRTFTVVYRTPPFTIHP